MPDEPWVRVLKEGLSHAFESPNESDSNGEIANVVDGLYAISRSLRSLARAIADPEGWKEMNR